MAMSDEEAIGPKEQLAHHGAHFRSTRDTQWKNNTAVWTALLATSYVGLTTQHSMGWGSFLLLFVIYLHVHWNLLVQQSLDFDRDRIVELLGTQGKVDRSRHRPPVDRFSLLALTEEWVAKHSGLEPHSARWVVLQGCVTIFLSLVAAICLISSPVRSEGGKLETPLVTIINGSASETQRSSTGIENAPVVPSNSGEAE